MFISTHSITMIKATDKHHIMLLNDKGRGRFEVLNPCYPAKAIGCVDLWIILSMMLYFCRGRYGKIIVKEDVEDLCTSRSAIYHDY